MTRAATYSPNAGPCLNPWPEPPPASQTLSKSGWRSIRKSPGKKRARQFERISTQISLGGVRVNGLAMTIEPEFEAAIFKVGQAVSFGAEIDPGRRHRRSETRVARRDAEEVDLLARRVNSISKQRREEFRQPGAACENEYVRADPRPSARNYFIQPARARWRERRLDQVIGAVSRDEIRHRLNCAAGHQRAAHRLVNRPAYLPEIDLRIAALQFIATEKLEIHSDSFERLRRGGDARIAFAGHQQHAGPMKKLQSPDAREELLPDRQRTVRPACVDFIRAVTHPYDARFVARTRATVRRAVSVNQRDAQPRALQVIRGPRPEDPGADYDCVVAFAHVFPRRIPGTHRFQRAVFIISEIDLFPR